MKIDMKQRIIGAVVIIALAIILIPLFVSQHQHDEIIKQAQISSQPENPSVNSVNQLQALNTQITEQAQDKVDWQALQPAPAATQPAPTQEPSNIPQYTAPESAKPDVTPTAPAVAQPEPQPAPQMQPSAVNPIDANAQTSTAPVAQPAPAMNPADIKTAENNEANTPTMNEKSEVNTEVEAEDKTVAKINKKSKAKISAKPRSPKVAKSTSANTFLIQLGNFSSKKNASVLKTRLEKHGFHPTIEESNGHFRVLVGPSTSHEKATQKLQLIAQKANVTGFIVRG